MSPQNSAIAIEYQHCATAIEAKAKAQSAGVTASSGCRGFDSGATGCPQSDDRPEVCIRTQGSIGFALCSPLSRSRANGIACYSAGMIGSRLRRAREAAGLTRPELSKLVPCSPGLIYEYEKGLRSPGADNLKGLAQGCGVSADYLLGIAVKR